MSSFTVLTEVGQTLEALIKDQWGVATDLQCPEISFDSPYELIKTGKTSILSIYLFQVSENTHLKNLEPQPFLDTELEKIRYPPLALDLLYLITPLGNPPAEANAANEMLILGKVMQILHDNMIIPNDKFDHKKFPINLKDSYNQMKILFHPFSLDDLTKIWNAFQETPYRLCVGYLVTPVMIDSMRVEDIPKRVIEKIEEHVQEERLEVD